MMWKKAKRKLHTVLVFILTGTNSRSNPTNSNCIKLMKIISNTHTIAVDDSVHNIQSQKYNANIKLIFILTLTLRLSPAALTHAFSRRKHVVVFLGKKPSSLSLIVQLHYINKNGWGTNKILEKPYLKARGACDKRAFHLKGSDNIYAQ